MGEMRAKRENERKVFDGTLESGFTKAIHSLLLRFISQTQYKLTNISIQI